MAKFRIYSIRFSKVCLIGQKKLSITQISDQKTKGFDALRNIAQIVEDGQKVADQINLELDNQISQLDRMYNTIQDTITTLARSKKHIKYFARQLYTDKLIMCLIVLIFLVILALIILKAMGKSVKPSGKLLLWKGCMQRRDDSYLDFPRISWFYNTPECFYYLSLKMFFTYVSYEDNILISFIYFW